MKIILNVSKLDSKRERKGNRNPNNRYSTFIVNKLMQPDEDGNTHCVQYAQTMSEIKNKAKRLYVGKAMYMKGRSVVPDEDKEKFFMIYVEGKDAPVKKHLTYASAMHEAHRLAELGEIPYVLESVATVSPKKNGAITLGNTSETKVSDVDAAITDSVVNVPASDIAKNTPHVISAKQDDVVIYNPEEDDGIPKKKKRKRIAAAPTKVVIKK